MEVFFLVITLTLVTSSPPPPDLDSLVQLHVLFRNGDRTPRGCEIYQKDPYNGVKYSPFGLGQLTNFGRRKAYKIGQVFRKRYGDFLGDYSPDDFYGRSTEHDFATTSMELVLAGLYPPKGQQVWNEKDFPKWQPIPFHAPPLGNDCILQPTNCPYFKQLLKAKDTSSKQKKQYKKYKNTFDYISKNTGLNVTNFESVFPLYFALKGEENWGLTLPDWTKQVWPEKIKELVEKFSFETSATSEMRKISAGYFLRKIMKDIEQRAKGGEIEESGKKMNLYSAHQLNIADALIALGKFSKPHIPTYGSHLVFELHKKDDKYKIRILYHCYPDSEVELLKLDGCDDFCPLDKFKDKLKDTLPGDGLCSNCDD